MRLQEPRACALQLGALLLVLIVAGLIAANVAANVARFNLHVGFGFLGHAAGFAIAQTLISFPEGSTYLRAFVVSLLNTLLIACIGIAGSTVIGFFVALARLAPNPLLSWLAGIYVEAVRNIPLLLQLFFWYFAVLGPLPLPRRSISLADAIFLNKRGLFLPVPVLQDNWPWMLLAVGAGFVAAFVILREARRPRDATWLIAAAAPIALSWGLAIATGVTWDIPRLTGFNVVGGIGVIPECVAMALGLAVYGSAFVAELIRGGILTVGRGQTEAGLALGLSRWRILVSIVIPLALRAIVPPLTGQYITLLKNSSLAAAIGYPDLMLIFAGTSLNQTGQPLEIMAMTMVSYLSLSLIVSALGNVLNRRMQLVER